MLTRDGQRRQDAIHLSVSPGGQQSPGASNKAIITIYLPHSAPSQEVARALKATNVRHLDTFSTGWLLSGRRWCRQHPCESPGADFFFLVFFFSIFWSGAKLFTLLARAC